MSDVIDLTAAGRRMKGPSSLFGAISPRYAGRGKPLTIG